MEQIRRMTDTDDIDLCMQILSIASTVYRPVTLEELGSLIERPISSPEFEPLSDSALDTQHTTAGWNTMWGFAAPFWLSENVQYTFPPVGKGLLVQPFAER